MADEARPDGRGDAGRYTRECPCGCGETFTTDNQQQKYKAPSHRKRAYRRRKRRQVGEKLARRLLEDALDPDRIAHHLNEIEEEV